MLDQTTHVQRKPSYRERRLRREVYNLDDFQRLARARLPRAVYGYVANGSEAGNTLLHNRTVFGHWRLVPRVLRDVSVRSQETAIFGQSYAAPFGIAPMGSSAVISYDGDNRMARAARAANIPYVLSANSITPMEELVRSNPGAWFAAYQSAEASKIEEMVRRVADTGINVFGLTVDVPVGSNREQDKQLGYSMPLRPTPRTSIDGLTHPRWLASGVRTMLTRGLPAISNVDAENRVHIFSRRIARITGHAAFSWKQAELIRRLWKGPFVVKGILSPEDARIARESGVDGIVVSNHGGRQLDMCVSPMDVLADVKAQSGEMKILVDSGFRRGTDILQALALGADFVLIGRPFQFACVLAGERGVRHAISLLVNELDIDLALLGLRSVSEAGPELLRAAF